MPLWQTSTKKLLLLKISTKPCLVGKVPQQQDLLENFCKMLLYIFPENLVKLENFQKNPCWKSFTNNLFCWKISTKKWCIANFHQKLLFFWKFSKTINLWTNFHKKLHCFKISTQNLFIEKFSHKIYLLKISKTKPTCGKISTTIWFVGKLHFWKISTKWHFVGKLSILALRLLYKTPNEIVVKSIGSVLEKQMKP